MPTSPILHQKFYSPFLLMLLSLFLFSLLSVNFHFLIWVSLCPLILLSFKERMRTVLPCAMVFGLLVPLPFVNFSSWGDSYYLGIYAGLIGICSLFFTLFMATICILRDRVNISFLVLLPTMIWMSLTLLHLILPLQLYWMDFSLFSDPLIPFISLLGSFGITALIILSNSALALFFLSKKHSLLLTPLLVLLLHFFSFFYASFIPYPQEEPIIIALAQGNFPYDWQWREDHAQSIFDTYYNLSVHSLNASPDVIIWPEYSILADFYTTGYIERLESFSIVHNVTLIVGAAHPFDKTHSDRAYVFNNGQHTYYDSTNPFFFDSDVKKGEFSSNSVAICNEETIPSISRNIILQGNTFLVFLSNNQHLGRGQHLLAQFSKLRAAEHLKFAVRATNDGITQIIDPYGRVTSSLEPGKQKLLIGTIYKNHHQTFYAKHGHVLLYIFMLASALLLIKRGK